MSREADLVEALECAVRDLKATYDAAASRIPIVISIGAFGRLRRMEDILARYRASAEGGEALLQQPINCAPHGCYCGSVCMAPVIMGVQQPCRRRAAQEPRP